MTYTDTLKQSRRLAQTIVIGHYFAAKYRNQQRELGTLKTAKNLRKQGIDIQTAVLLLARG